MIKKKRNSEHQIQHLKRRNHHIFSDIKTENNEIIRTVFSQ